jgi:hypothetical protein
LIQSGHIFKQMDILSKLAVEDFSLAKSGRLNWVLDWLGLDDPSMKGYLKRSVAIVLVTWLPLLILSAVQGLAWGRRVDMNFLEDFATHAKYLVIIPLLIFSEHSVDHRIKELTAQFFKSGILGEKDLPEYDRLKRVTTKLSDSKWDDLVILIIIITNIVIRWKNIQHTSIWLIDPDAQGGHISWAGSWFVLFSLPVMQYILLRWLWRWIIWLIYFTKISRMPLQLSPAHPDKAGGIGFLGIPPAPFLQVTLAMSILFSTIIAEKVFWQHDKLPVYYPVMIGFAIICIIINVLPLIVFIKPMAQQRRQGIFDYSRLIQNHHRLFDEKWLGKDDVKPLLGSQDASSTTDLNTTFDTVMGMRVFPFNLKTMISSILIAILPMLPLLAFEYDWLDLLKKVVGMLI